MVANSRFCFNSLDMTRTDFDLFNFTEFSVKDIDWWFWVIIAVFPTFKFIFFWWLFRAPKRSEPVTSNLIEGKVVSVLNLPSTVDPVSVRLELDGEIEGKRKLLPLLRSADGAHEHSSGGVRFEAEDSAFIFAVDSTAADSSGDESSKSLIAKVKSSKGRKFQVAVRVTLRTPAGDVLTGKTKSRAFDSLETNSAMVRETVSLNPKGSVDLEISSRKIESNMDRLVSSRKTLAAAFRQQRLLLVASHLWSVALFILLVTFGLRFLFSGAFIASIAAIVLSGLFALSSIPVLAVWAALGTLAHGGSVRRVTQLNSQARAYLAIVGAVVLSVLSVTTSTNTEAIQDFQILSLLQLLNGVAFGINFIQFEAAGQVGAFFHFNCLKRPIEEVEV